MSIGDKPVHPYQWENRNFDIQEGLTYREWLIGMIASGDKIAGYNAEDNEATLIIKKADAIIKQLDKESE